MSFFHTLISIVRFSYVVILSAASSILLGQRRESLGGGLGRERIRSVFVAAREFSVGALVVDKRSGSCCLGLSGSVHTIADIGSLLILVLNTLPFCPVHCCGMHGLVLSSPV